MTNPFGRLLAVGLLLGIAGECFLISKWNEHKENLDTRTAVQTGARTSMKSEPLQQSTPPAIPEAKWLRLDFGRSLIAKKAPEPLSMARARKQFPYYDGAQLKKARALEIREITAIKYGALLNKFSLTPEAREKLITALANFSMLEQDMSDYFVSSPTTLAQQSRSKLEMQQIAKEELKSAMMDAAGAEGYQTYQDYEKHLDRYSTVTAFDQDLRMKLDQSLTPEQYDRLAAIFASDTPTDATSVRLFTDAGNRGQIDVSGIRFSYMNANVTIATPTGEMSSGYVPSEEALAKIQAEHLVSPAQWNVLRKLAAKRVAQVDLATLLNINRATP